MRFSLPLPVFSVGLLFGSWLQAASPPSEALFPNTTRGWISVQDIDQLREQFQASQPGQLVHDPLMKPFIDDLREVLREKMNVTDEKFGLKINDLKELYAGELGFGLIQPNVKDPLSHALALTLDVTGKEAEVLAFLARVEKTLLERKAVKETRKLGSVAVTHFTLPLKPEAKTADVVLFTMHADTLFMADHLETLQGMLTRAANAQSADSLARLPAYAKVMERVTTETAASTQKVQAVPDFRWFLEPLNFAETNRAAGGGKKKRGVDPITVLRKNGFDELRGVGGFVHFATDRQEALYRTYLHAPLVNSPPAGQKRKAAAGMSEFPNGSAWDVQPWVPHGVSAYLTFNWKMQQAFDHFGQLFDGFTEEGTFEEILLGLESDPTGPMVSIRKEIIGLLGERVTLLSDYRLPIDTRCERLLVAFELKAGEAGHKAALAAIRKLMNAEPGARKVEAEGHELWEIVEQIDEAEIPEIRIDGPGFVAFEPKLPATAPVAANVPAPAPPGIVLAVAHGNIFVGTHVDFMLEVLEERPEAARLSASHDFQIVEAELARLGCREASFRCFTRTDDAYRPTFELLQKGDLPKAETVLAKGLNHFLNNSGKKGEVRQALVDGKNLPSFEKIRHYLGPAGFYAHTEAEGWLVTGCLLRKSEEAVAKKE